MSYKNIKFHSVEESIQLISTWQTKIYEIIDRVFKDSDQRYDKIVDTFKLLDDKFFFAPASGKLDYHCAWPGGLAQHTLNVITNAIKLSKAMCPDRYSLQTIVFSALFHDLGKVGNGEIPYFVPETESYWREKRGSYYNHNEELVNMNHSERSLWLLAKFGIPVSAEEWQAIHRHDGYYVDSNKDVLRGHREEHLSYIIHVADCWSCKKEKYELTKGIILPTCM